MQKLNKDVSYDITTRLRYMIKSVDYTWYGYDI
jgi:hypothetical protein